MNGRYFFVVNTLLFLLSISVFIEELKIEICVTHTRNIFSRGVDMSVVLVVDFIIV